MLNRFVRWTGQSAGVALCVCVVACVWAPCVNVSAAEEHDDAAHVAAEADHADGTHATSSHAPGHDPFEDVLHSNAGPQQDSFTEVRGSLAFWTLIVFGLLLSILWKFAWGPLTEALDRREASILASIAGAKEQNDRAAKLLADHEARLAGTADEVRRILDEARRDADSQKQAILAEAEAGAIQQKERAIREIEVAKNGALQELAQKSVDTAMGLAGKIVQRQLSADDHASLISEALQHFPSKN